MSSYVGFQLGRERVLLIGGIAFALIAVTLAAVGLYGVMALYVRSRQREIGVRMAFGATRARVVRMVIEESLRIALAGVAMGAASAMVVSKVAHAAFQGTAPLNLVTLLAAIGAVTLVCVAAALVPSCQASSIEPLGAIRAE
jgi:ABC-type antimicrobial peptide transport system permease subunit